MSNTDFWKNELLESFPGIENVPGVKLNFNSDNCWVPVDMLAKRKTNDSALSRLNRQFPKIHDKLYDYQKDDVSFFSVVKRGIIAHPCSGRKTLSGLSAALATRTSDTILIIGPAMSRITWESEYKRWVADANTKFLSLSGKTPVALKLGESGITFVFVNYEVLSSWSPELKKHKLGAIIMDEFHEFRGRDSSRFNDGLKHITFRNPECPRIGLTATPIWTRLDGLHNMFQIICPGVFGTLAQYKMRYMGGFEGKFGGIETSKGVTNADELKTRFDYWVRAVEVSGLPDISRQIIYIKDEEVSKKVNAAASRIAATGEDPDKAYRNIMSELSKYTPIKFPMLKEKIVAGRNVVCCQFIVTTVKFVEYATKNFKGATVYFFTGETPQAKRLEIIDKASKDKFSIVVCTMGAAKQSIDMAKMDNIYVIEPPFGSQEAIQFEGRFRRVTREGIVNIEYLVIEDSPDMRCVELISEKLEAQVRIVGDSASSDFFETFSDDGVDKVLKGMLERILGP